MALLRGACIGNGQALFHLCGLPDYLTIQQAGKVRHAPHQTAIYPDRADRAIFQTGPFPQGLVFAGQGMGGFMGRYMVAPGSDCGQSGRNLNLGRVKKVRHIGITIAPPVLALMRVDDSQDMSWIDAEIQKGFHQ